VLIDGRSALEWVILDVGETLIDETRAWDIWADVLGIGRQRLATTLGATIAADDHHHTLFDVLRVPDWRSRIPEVERRFGGFQRMDLYPDALRSMEALRELGFRLGVVANQPASRTAELRSIGVDADVIAMSDELGVAKPDPVFFARLLGLLGDVDPERVAYVGDRVDNDVMPSRAAGLRAVWIRRGPWGAIQSLPDPAAADLVVSSLDELVARIGEL
jgi:HAD superfamily hydrolase (TIGR01549 family)